MIKLDTPSMLRLSRRLRGTFAARRALGAALFICLCAMNVSAAESKQKPLHVMNIKLYAPKYHAIETIKSEDTHLLVIDIADLHIGKLATAFE